MPITLADNEQRSARSMLQSGARHDYDYPYNLKLRPTEKLHDDIVNNIMLRATESNDVMSARHSSWNEIDQMLTAYIQPSSDSQKAQLKDRNKPVEIVIPQSYATMEILLTYMTSALLDGSVFQYEGRSPEDVIGAVMLEKVIDMQMYHTKSPLALHTGFRDGFAYGFGLLAPEWITEYSMISKKMPKAPSFFDGMLGRDPGFERVDVEEMLFEGNKINNIDPYLALPDPNVPIDRLQEGEFVGWIDKTNYKNLLSSERYNEDYFNVRYLNELRGNSGISRLCKSEASGRGLRSGISEWTSRSGSTNSRIDVIKMFIDIIPQEWKLPGGPTNRKGEYPETWYFEVAADVVLIKCKRLGLNHGMKPIAAISPDYDGYSVSPISRMEMINGLQKVTNFLFNSHITNVRKAINDMLIVDPSLINMDSLSNPEPGKLITIRRAAWGRGVENAVQQLAINDVTRQHMGDTQLISQYTKEISGANDALSGVRRKTSERVTAQEVQRDTFGSMSRLEKIAKVCSWMGMQDLGYMLASHTQQLMSMETYVKITGAWQEILIKEHGMTVNSDRMKVSPYDILVAYDIIAKDGTIPGGNFSQIWVQMLPTLMQNMELMQRFDIVRIVKHIMRNAGAKDIDQFDRRAPVQQPQQPPIQANVMPNDQVQQQVDAGNLIPAMEGAA